MNVEANSTKSWRLKTSICFVLLLLTFAAYYQVYSFEFVNYDDPDYVTSNPHVQAGLSWSNIKWAFCTSFASNWHPLTWLSHMLDCQFFGLNPAAHHLTNLLFHSANSILIFLLFFKLTGGIWRSALLAALFSLHPIHVESVAWIAERKDVLSTFFFLLTIYAYAGYARRPRGGTYLLSLFLFSLALISKPMVVTLPFLLLVLDFWPLNRFQFVADQTAESAKREGNKIRWTGLILEKVPFALLALASCIITLIVQNKGGAVHNDALPLPYRIANAIVSYERYLEKLLWPADLAVFYPHPGHWPVWRICLALLLIMAISFICLRTARRNPHLLAGWLWFLGTLVPVIGLVQAGSQSMADRYSYIPSIGFFVLIIWTIPEMQGATRLNLNKIAWSAAIWILLLCIGLTHLQVGYWRNSFELFTHALKATTTNAVAHCQLGISLSNNGKTSAAIQEFESALRIDPRSAFLYNNYGFALSKIGATAQAVEAFHRALELDPKYPEAQNNLASTLALDGKLDEAEKYYLLALQNRPDYPEVLNNFGNVRALQGKLSEAEGLYTKALRLVPTYAEAHNNLAGVQIKQAKEEMAISHLKQVVKLQPDLIAADLVTAEQLIDRNKLSEAENYLKTLARIIPHSPKASMLLAKIAAKQDHFDEALGHILHATGRKENDPEIFSQMAFLLLALGKQESATTFFQRAMAENPKDPNLCNNLANNYAMRGMLKEAANQYLVALAIKPDFVEAHYNLGNVLMMNGKPDEAIYHYEEAARLKPDYTDARVNLGEALAKQGKYSEAREHFQAALRTSPDNVEAHYQLGLIFYQLGKKDQAMHQFQEVVRLKPGYEDVERQIALLSSFR